jgi:hypothetical protein
MSLAVLERNKEKHVGSRVIKAGMKLLCYEDSYGFTNNMYYRISAIKDGYITVRDNDRTEVIFADKEDLKTIFYIIYE